LYRFRYQVYVEDQGFSPPGADHSERTLTDPLDDCSFQYAIVSEGQVVGSLRATLLSDLDFPKPLITRFRMEEAIERFGRSVICTTSRFIIARAYRGSRVSLRLMEAAYEDARMHGIRLNYGDCSLNLIHFYERMGYRAYGPAFEDPDYGVKAALLMLIGDRDRFRSVGSPLRRAADCYPDDAEARDWFEGIYRQIIDQP
jgi:GNAT superfamily N-acetyltransferase